MLFGKGMKGLCRANVRLFDVLLGHSWFLRNPDELKFASCWMSIFSETWDLGGRSWEKAQVWVGLPAEKAAQGMQEAGTPIINGLLWRGPRLDIPWEGLAYREEKL